MVEPGTRCRAIYAGDHQWYDGVVDAVTDNGCLLVTFPEYGNTETIQPEYVLYVGMNCCACIRGMWFDARIERIDAGSAGDVFVAYAENGAEFRDKVDVKQICFIDMRVEARYPGDNRWYPGIIRNIYLDGFEIFYLGYENIEVVGNADIVLRPPGLTSDGFTPPPPKPAEFSLPESGGAGRMRTETRRPNRPSFDDPPPPSSPPSSSPAPIPPPVSMGSGIYGNLSLSQRNLSPLSSTPESPRTQPPPPTSPRDADSPSTTRLAPPGIGPPPTFGRPPPGSPPRGTPLPGLGPPAMGRPPPSGPPPVGFPPPSRPPGFGLPPPTGSRPPPSSLPPPSGPPGPPPGRSGPPPSRTMPPPGTLPQLMFIPHFRFFVARHTPSFCFAQTRKPAI